MARTEKERQDHGLLVRWLEAATKALIRLSLGKKLEGIHPDRLDVYVLSWLAFEIALIVLMVFVHLASPVTIVLIVLFSYHLFEIAITSFNSVIIRPIEHKKHHSMPRLFSLVFFDYIELILIFGIIFKFILDNASMMKSMLYSVSLATLAGANFDEQTNAVLLASIFELLLSVFFIAGAIATIANYLGPKE